MAELCDRCDCGIPARGMRDALAVYGVNGAGTNIVVLICKRCVGQTLLLGSCWPYGHQSGDPYLDLLHSQRTAYLIGELCDLRTITLIESGTEFLEER